MAGSRSFYDILNVAPGAEGVVIDAAYRALMKKYHPDQGPRPEGGMSAADINEAFAVLRDPQRRADYDQREWARRQSVRLAAYPPLRPPPRRSVFGWGGWVVALVLGGVVALMASRTDGVAGPPAEAEALAAPDFRSQPTLPDIPAIPAAAAPIAAIPAAAAPLEPPPTALGADAVAPELPAARAPLSARDAAPPAAAPRPARSAPRARPRSRVAPEEEDFLEREGYIY